MGHSTRGVLVVSTDFDTLRTLAHALTLSGYAVTTETEWCEAMGKICRLPPAVMLLDVKDLDRSEWERLAVLRKAHPELPVVLLSSLESRELTRAVDEGLVADYLMKPIDLTALETRLDRLGREGEVARA
jgi:DNA-binding response OmpR family regulator